MPIRPARLDELTPDYKSIAAKEAEAAGLPSALVHQLIDQESKWNPKAISPKGARGLMQLMPETAKSLGVDPDDPIQNIRGGVRYLKQQFDRYEGDTAKALAAYNAGPGAVDKFGGVPPYSETQEYVTAVGQRQPTTVAPTRGRVRPATPTEIAKDRLTIKPARIGPGPDWGTRVSRWITPAVGAIGGGIKGGAMGSVVGGPIGSFVGAVTGAGIGAGAGELLQAGYERVVGQAPPTPRGIVRRVGSAMTTGAVSEATGRGAGHVISRALTPILRPFASKVEPHAQEAIETLRTAGSPPRPLVLPAQISRSRVLDIGQNIAEGSFVGGGRITDVKQAQQLVAEQKVLDVLDQLGPHVGPKATGTAMRQSRQQAIQQFRGEERQAWGAFEQEVGAAPLPGTPRLDQFIAEATQREAGTILPNAGMTAAQRVAALTGEEPAGLLIGGVEMDFKALPASVQQALVQAGHAPPTPTLSVAQFRKTVSNLGTLSRRLERAAKIDPTKSADLGLSKKLYSLAQEDLDEAVAAIGPKATTAYQDARAVSRLGNQRLFNEEVRRIAKAAPEKVTSRLMKRNNSTAIEAVREAVDSDTFGLIQATAMENLLRVSPKTKQVNWGTVATRFDQLGDDTLSAMFPGGHAADVKKTVDLMLRMNEQQASGIGRMAIQLSQGGAVLGLATGALRRGALEMTLAPYVIARIFSSPRGLRWLSTGLQSPAGSREAITATTQLVAFLGREGLLSAEYAQELATENGQRPVVTSGAPPAPTVR